MAVVMRTVSEASTAEAALALCAANNACSVHSTMTCLDPDRSHNGSWALTVVDDLIVSRTRRLSLVYQRDGRHISGDADDSVMVHFNTGHNWFAAEQLGRDYDLAPGSGGIWVHNAPIRAACGDGCDFYGIGVPRALTRLWRLSPEDLVGRTFDVRSPPHRLLRVYMDMLATCSDLDDDMAQAMKIHIAELTGLWLGGLKDSHWRDANPQARQQTRALAIRAFLERHYADHGLSAAATGRALGLSERLVQHVLTQDGTSFSKCLGQVRAEAAHARLSDAAWRGRSVAAIAQACGFNDLSSFYRAFRARYDLHPADLRP